MEDNTQSNIPGIVMFPVEILELQEEIQRHPDLLLQLLDLFQGADVGEKLGVVAAYVDIVLDGYYGEEDIFKLCKILVKRLQNKRSSAGSLLLLN